MKQFFNFTVFAAVCVLGLSSTASSQELITWETSEQMYPGETAQTFVNTNGVLAYAANMDRDDTRPAVATLNGVDFNTTNIAGLATLMGPGGVTMSTTVPGETGTSFGDGSFDGDGDIFNVIGTGMFGPGDVTFSGLTPGQTYEIQVFVNDSRNGRHEGFVCLLSNGVDTLTLENAATCRHSNREFPFADPIVGEPSGDSITGTFVAGTTGIQTFSTSGSTDGGVTFEGGGMGRAQINAIQLRDVTDVEDCLLGDVNTSGAVDFADIAPFIGLLSTGTFQCEADVNESLTVDFADIAPFIGILAGA